MRNRRLAFVAALLAVLAGPARATTMILDFSSLPSQQGWEYHHDGNMEWNVFSTDGTRLILDSLGDGMSRNWYRSFNLEDNLPYTLFCEVRILADEDVCCPDDQGFQLGFGVVTNPYELFIGLSASEARDSAGERIAVDNSAVHLYQLDFYPLTGQYILKVDNLVAMVGQAVPAIRPNQLVLGDLTRASNAHAEITQFVFTQEEPIATDVSSWSSVKTLFDR